MSRASPLPRSGDRSKAVMVGVMARLRVIAYKRTGLSNEYWTLYVRAILDQRCDGKRPLMRRRPIRNLHWLLHNDIERDHEGDRQRGDVGCGAVLKAV